MLWPALGPLAVAASLGIRLRQTDHGDPLERWTLAAALAFACVGMVGAVLGLFGLLDPIALSLACASLAAMLWPWRRVADTRGSGPARESKAALWVALGIAVLTVGLRWPAADYGLAGRDQGTYTLRAQQVLRTASWEHQDPLLREAAQDTTTRSGPSDVLGLYPKRSERWRRGRYEAAYRPGWYLADRDAGRVVPQFFHFHPAWLAIAGMVAGPAHLTDVIVLQALLLLLCLFCIGRRLFARAGQPLFWAALAALIVTANPLAIWVHRTALSETPTSLLLWASVLAICRAGPSPSAHATSNLEAAALLLAATGWVRGNAWLTAPLVLAVLWLLPRGRGRRRPVAIYLAVMAGSVLAHAGSTFPYLADELNKQLHVTWLKTPETLVGGFACLAAVWWSVDALAFDRSSPRAAVARIRRLLPTGLALIAAAGLLLYVVLRLLSPQTHARLDPVWPLLGPVVCIAAVVGLGVITRRADPLRADHVWLSAVGATIAATVVLYAQRNLPRAGLFYYGRYLAPELLPVAALLCVAGLHAALARLPARLGRVAAVGVVAVLAWTVAGPLVRTPHTRLREFAGASRLAQTIDRELEPGAVVIAGGEGWHHGHTYNQVGGALMFAHGVDVLPYYGREALYATLYELLIEKPAAHGTAAPPMYLLLGEATHHYRPESKAPARAAFDDLLPPPFVAEDALALELFTDRLTPVARAMPARVTRDELRMVLVRVGVDPSRSDERRWDLGPTSPVRARGFATRGPAGVCLEQGSDATFQLPTDLRGPGSLVIVMTPGTSGANETLQLHADDASMPLGRYRAARRAHDTLGPLPFRSPPRVITLAGLSKGRLKATCPFGGVAEIRWLGLDRGIAWDRVRATTLAPPRDLGHPVEPTLWVPGRGLSRYRPGFSPEPENLAGLSLVLTPARPLAFPLEPLPSLGAEPLDVIVTLTQTKLAADARIVLRADGDEVARIDPPDDRRGSWQSPPVLWTPQQPHVRWSLTLESAADEPQHVHLRDIGLFSRSPVVRSQAADSL